MTDNTKPSELTDEQIIERLATEVMGWNEFTTVPSGSPPQEWGKHYWVDSNGDYVMHCADWNPLTSWNDFRLVEERVMDYQSLTNIPKDVRGLLWVQYVCELGGDCFDSPFKVKERALKASLPERARALISALDSLLCK